MSWSAILAIATTLLAPPSVPPGADTLTAADAARRALHAQSSRSILTITSYNRVPDGAPRTGRWLHADDSPHAGFARHQVASGILVDGTGIVMCCRSPLLTDDAGFSEIIDVETANGTRLDARLLASEPTINLAVLQIAVPPEGLPDELVPASFGTVETLSPGDSVFAVGDPFGSARCFAPGVVMAIPTAACYQADLTGSLIHGSMAVDPGAMGGALITPDGKVIGMLVPPPTVDASTVTAPHPYVTYAMQIQTVLGVGQALKSKRTNESPWVGYSVLSQRELKARMKDDAAFDALTKPEHGLYVDDVYDPSPASKAGVRSGDFILEINGARISSVVDFQQSLYYYSGTEVPMTFSRNGKEYRALLPIERRPVDANRDGTPH